MSLRISGDVLAWAGTVIGNPKNVSPKLLSSMGGGGGSKWHEALAFGPRATTYPVTGDKSLHILKSVSSVKGSQLGLSPQGYYKDCVSQSTGKGLTAIKLSEPLKARGLTSAIL